MHSRRRSAFVALGLGLAVVSAAVAPSFAQSVETPRTGAAAQDTPTADPGLAPDATLGDPQADEAPAAKLDRQPSGVTRQLADWVTASGDNGDLPFMIVDKLGADVFAFDASGRLLGRAAVLVGLAHGDDSAPGVGDLKLSAISPDERTTPAGRFVAQMGGSDGHGTVLWVDYANAISMHPVITTNPSEHRLRRIKSASPEDHRISFGCINVPTKFYQDVVETAFSGGGVVYVLPDTKPLAEIFPAFAAAAQSDPDRKPLARLCPEAPSEVPDRVPDSRPSLVCSIAAGQTVEASATSLTR